MPTQTRPTGTQTTRSQTSPPPEDGLRLVKETADGAKVYVSDDPAFNAEAAEIEAIESATQSLPDDWPEGRPTPQAVRDHASALCRRLDEIRESRGLSFADLAGLTGLDRSNVHRTLSGKGNPAIRSLTLIALALNANLSVSAGS